MEPLDGDIVGLCKTLTKKKCGILLNGEPEASFELSTQEVNREIEFTFPHIIHDIKELFVLCHSAAISSQEENLGILVAWPNKNRYRIYPQKWFNKGKFDFTYQWITKIARAPKTGEVVGEGIRIRNFILNSDLTQVKRWL